MTSYDPFWYAVRTQTRREISAAGGLQEQSIRVYVPMETVSRKVGGERRPHNRPLWPGYLFVQCETHQFAPVVDTLYVAGFVRMMTTEGVSVPAPFPAGAIEEVQAMETRGEFDHTATNADWKPERGEAVRIIGGKWGAMGYVAKVLSVSTNERRALVTLENGFKIEEGVENLVAAA